MEMKDTPPSYPQCYSHSVHVLPRKRLNSVLVAAVIFCAIAVVLLGVAVSTDYWYDNGSTEHFGLWRNCKKQICQSTINWHGTSRSGLQAYSVWIAMRVLLLVGVGFGALSILLISLALCNVSPKCCAVTSGILLIFSSLFMSAVIAVFALAYIAALTIVQIVGGGYYSNVVGYSFILCSIADASAFIAGILAYVGACVDRNRDMPGVVIAP